MPKTKTSLNSPIMGSLESPEFKVPVYSRCPACRHNDHAAHARDFLSFNGVRLCRCPPCATLKNYRIYAQTWDGKPISTWNGKPLIYSALDGNSAIGAARHQFGDLHKNYRWEVA